MADLSDRPVVIGLGDYCFRVSKHADGFRATNDEMQESLVCKHGFSTLSEVWAVADALALLLEARDARLKAQTAPARSQVPSLAYLPDRVRPRLPHNLPLEGVDPMLSLRRGDIVVALRSIDGPAANVKVGDKGVVFQEANEDPGFGPMVAWMGPGSYNTCNVYKGDVRRTIIRTEVCDHCLHIITVTDNHYEGHLAGCEALNPTT